jgi:hypothetical protein
VLTRITRSITPVTLKQETGRRSKDHSSKYLYLGMPPPVSTEMTTFTMPVTLEMETGEKYQENSRM